MKINALIAAALVAASSTAFAGINDGQSTQEINGGEMILAMWDSGTKSSILFDTGIHFKDIIDNKNNAVVASVDLTTIDATYKSFFAGQGVDIKNVQWNAFVSSNWGDNEQYIDGTYFGMAYTSKNPNFEVANPFVYTDTVAFITSQGEAVSRFNENFANPSDTTDDSVNRSYRVTSTASTQGYLGGSRWGDQMAGINGRGTSTFGDSSIAFVYNGTTDYDSGFVAVIGLASFDSASNVFKITNPNAPAVPVPAAAWLLMSGIAGFGAIARRRKQQA